jgi:hypothetical protein
MAPILRSAGILAPLLFGALFVSAQAPIGEVFAADASISGTVLYAGSGTRVLSGSKVAAGARAAVLKLVRGGEVRICPNTSVAVSASPNGRNLLFSMNEGEVEFHFTATSDGDALQTPDFRIQFAGPGEFDLAMCTDKQGGLALRGKSGSRAAVIVSEMMGDGIYQVPTGRSVDFRQGTVRDPQEGVGPCGCPEAPLSIANPTLLAEQAPPPPTPPTPEPKLQPAETHVQVDAPFVYQGDELKAEAVYTLAKLQTVTTLDAISKLQPVVTPPLEKNALMADKAEQKKSGFFKKIGSFFGKIFHG